MRRYLKKHVINNSKSENKNKITNLEIRWVV